MAKSTTVPDVLLNKIGTEMGGFIITTVYPLANKKWKVWGIKNYTPTTTEIEEWKNNTKLNVGGTFAFCPGEPIGFFKPTKK